MTFLSLLMFILDCDAFRCFSEYEFRWWDAGGIEHINGFSMSHFQMKMKSFLVDNSTNRVPFKEAFFLVKLHPSYHSNMTDECPHALIQAHFLVAALHAEAGSRDTAVDQYSQALSIFNHAPAVHQQVALLAWPFDRLKREVEARFHSRGLRVLDSISVVVLGDEYWPFDLAQLLARFLSRTLHVQSEFSEIYPLFDSVSKISANLSACEFYSSVLSDGVTLYLDLRVPVSFNLIRVYLEYVLNGATYIPPHYSFGTEHRLGGGYTGISFGQFGGPNEYTCGLSSKSREDDESLPWSLRLSRGDEPFKSDWRDVLLSPVLPRKPVTQ